MMWNIGGKRSEVLPHSLLQNACLDLKEFDLSSQDKAMLGYVMELTISPTSMEKKHVDNVRKTGFSDREIHDIVMIVSCFSFMNRLADGTGVTCLPKQQPFATELLGAEAWSQHICWSHGE